jgi:hypothetical protein
MLDLMLSNHPNSYSVGEVSSLFYPVSLHHVDPICGCGRSACPEWIGIKAAGRKKLYQSIFDRHPELQVIVDSSKDLLWIKEQSKNLSNSNIQVLNLLIWKTPDEFAYSLSKRGREAVWKKSWVTYHTKYISFVRGFRSVRTAALLESPDTLLPALCDYVGLQSRVGQAQYWGKEHHTLFGSAASRIHLHEPGSQEFQRLEKYIVRKESKGHNHSFNMKKYRTIHNARARSGGSNAYIHVKLDNDTHVLGLVDNLTVSDVLGPNIPNLSTMPFFCRPGLGWYYKSLLRRSFRRLFKIRMETYR